MEENVEETSNKIPMFFTSDIDGKTIIYKLNGVYDDGYTITAVYNQAKAIHTDGSDTISEDVSPSSAESFILETNSKNPFFNDTYKDQELVWFNGITEIDEVVAVCML